MQDSDVDSKRALELLSELVKMADRMIPSDNASNQELAESDAVIDKVYVFLSKMEAGNAKI